MTQPKTETNPTPQAAPATSPAPVYVAVEHTTKKRKRKYSRGLGTLQHVERGVTRSAATIAEGVAKVFTVYTERSDKSSRRKRDGALRDGIENWTKAMSRGLRVAGEAPYKLVREINRGPGSKQVRDTVRLLTPPPLR
jgi:hypothetical protein